MQRLQWPLFIFFTAFVFTSGVICGMYWQEYSSLEVASEQQTPGHSDKRGRHGTTPHGEDDTFVPEQPAPPPLAESAPPAVPQPPSVAAEPVAPPQKESRLAEAPKPPALPEPLPQEPPDSQTNDAARPVSPARTAVVSALEKELPFTPSPYSFSLRKLGPGGDHTLMVVGGIQGDEPGGFSAASLIASHYTIHSGSVWVVPDLNFPSILNRSRGVKGDMNRKFAHIRADDPDYATVMQIKSILLDDRVSLILNLHDGSGFYRPTWEDGLHNPSRWGQSVIIDQEEMDAPRFSRLHETASLIGEEVNQKLLDPNHRYHIYNTLTARGNTEMAKTLSYFAVCNGKPAFGVEASKEIRPEYRTYYHLQVIEAFMRRMGISYTRNFPLTPEGVLSALNSNLRLSLFDNRVVLYLDDIRPNLNFMPFKKDVMPPVRSSKPLLALVPEPKQQDWRVAYGNRTLTRITPLYMDFDYSLETLEMELDGKPHTVRMGDLVSVRDSFKVRHTSGYRVNAIGAQKEKNGTEADVPLRRSDFMPRFSLDMGGSTYRVEVYKDKAFAGMVLIRFGDAADTANQPLTATGGSESALGF